MWSIDDQTLKQNSSDLLLDRFLVGLGKQVQESAGKVLRMAVWIAQLICDTVEEKVASLRIQIDSQILKDVHVRGVSYRTHCRGQSFGSQILDGGSTDVHDQGVDELNVVTISGRLAVRHLQLTSQI